MTLSIVSVNAFTVIAARICIFQVVAVCVVVAAVVLIFLIFPVLLQPQTKQNKIKTIENKNWQQNKTCKKYIPIFGLKQAKTKQNNTTSKQTSKT